MGAPAGDRGAAKRLEELRDEALAEIQAGVAAPDAAAHGVPVPQERHLYPATGETPRGVGEVLDPGFLEEPPIDLHPWYQVWSRDVAAPISSHRAGIGALLVGIKRLLRRFVKAPIADLFDRQRVYNAVLVHNITALQESVRVLSERSVPALIQRNDALYAVQDQRLELAVHDLEATGRKLAELRERVVLEVPAELRALGERLAAALNGLRDELRLADREATALFQDGHAQLRQSVVRLEARIDGAPRSPVGDAAPPAAAPASTTPEGDGAPYIDFENLFRGSEPAIALQQRFYLPYFRKLPGPVADLGAGRGEFLRLCREEGIDAYGVDADEDMVARAVASGSRALRADLLGHLASLPDGSLGGVFMAQVVEHLPRPRLLELARLCAAKLAPGGRVAMETQNPLSPMVLSRNFYLDLTHDRPIHPEGLRFLLEAAGFREVEVAYLSPFPEAIQLPRIAMEELPEGPVRRLALELDATVARLNQLLFGHQDYAILATR